MRAIIRLTTVFTLVFTLLNLQVVGSIQSLSFGVSFNQAQAEDNSSSGTLNEKLDDKGKLGSGMMSLITMLVIGLLAASMWVSCKKLTLDMMMVAAGGVIFIMGELLAIKGYKNLKKKDVSAYINSAGDNMSDSQVDALETQKKQMEEVRKLAKRKKMFQTAALVVFMTAAITAGVMEYRLSGELAACIGDAIAKGTSISGVAPPVAAACKTCTTTAKGLKFTSNGKGSSGKIDVTNKPIEITARKACALCATVACEPYINDHRWTTGICSPIPKAADSGFFNTYQNYVMAPVTPVQTPLNEKQAVKEKITSSVVEKIGSSHKARVIGAFLSMFATQAHAGWLELFGIAGAIGVVVLALYKTTWFKWDWMMSSPWKRAVSWLGVTLLIKMAMKSTDTVVTTADDNIEKLDRVIRKFNRVKRGTVQGSTSTLSTIPVVSPNSLVKTAIPLNDKSPCAVPGSTSSSCGSIGNAITTNPGISNLGSAVGNIAGQAGSVADGLQGTSNISSGTLSGIESLAGRQAFVEKALGQTIKRINDQRRKNNEKPVNFQGEAKKFVDGLIKGTRKAFERSSASPAQVLSALGSVPAGIEGEVAKKVKEDLKENGIKQTESVETSKSKGFNSGGFTFTGQDIADIEADANSENLDTQDLSNTNFKIKDNDIVKNKDVPIWKVLSIRYRKTAYPTFFESNDEESNSEEKARE